MTSFETHTLETVGDDGRDILETVNKTYGFVPNLLGKMVEAPALAKAYLDIGATFGETSFSETERQVVLLAVSRFHECEYCVAAHSAIAGMSDVPEDIVASIREDRPIGEPRLEALRRFTTTVLDKRGWLDDGDLAAFLDAGYERRQALEVLVGVAMKTMSNFTNHIAGTELDEAFAAAKWQAPK